MNTAKHSTQTQTKEAGQGFVEYAILLILVGIAVVAIVALMQPAIGDVFSRFVAQAPVAPPSLLNYTPPPTFTPTPTIDANATDTPAPSNTPVPSNTPIPTNTLVPSNTPVPSDTPVPSNTPSPTPCGPYGPFTVSTSSTVRIQIEDFRCGGSGVAFSDQSDGGPGSGTYRSDVGLEGPDLENGSEGINLGWTRTGEWLEYEIISPVSDSYSFIIRHAAPNGTNPQIRFNITSVDFGYQDSTNTLSVGTTGGWQNWQNYTARVTLFEGTNIVRLNIVNGTGNYNYFDIQPYVPTATPLPGTYLEAESGNGLTGNWVVANNGSASGGQYIYWNGNDRNNSPAPNDQITYSFNAPIDGLYQVHLRVNTRNSANDDSVWIRFDNADLNLSQNITRSDGWVKFNNMAGSSDWIWDQVHNADSGNALVQFYLTAGQQTLRLAYRENNTWIDQIYITNTGNSP